MSIEQFKNINDVIETKEVYLGQDVEKKTYDLINKGYISVDFPTINSPDPAINPVLMEFVLYDANNEILEQKDYGIVRYIAATEFNKYLIQSSNAGDSIKNNGGYLADVKTLISEAGYTTGYFRVQINFVRNRVGSNNQYEKVFVQEISPSRQEIRLLPYSNTSADKSILDKLNQQYQTFADGKFEWDSTLNDIQSLSDVIKTTDANLIVNAPSSTTPEGEFLLELQKEFGKSAASIIQSAIANVTSIDPVGDADTPYWYSKQDVIDAWIRAFKAQLTNALPKRNLVNAAVYNNITADSLDALTNKVQTIQSDITYGLPQIQRTVLDPTPPITDTPLIAETPPYVVDNTLVDPGTVINTPSRYNYVLTECASGVDQITGYSSTTSGMKTFTYNGKCFSVTGVTVSATTVYLAKDVNLDALVNTVYGCSTCINSLINNPPADATLSFVVSPYVTLTTQDTFVISWVTNLPANGTVEAYYASNNAFFTPGLSTTPVATSTITTFGNTFSISLGGLQADVFYDANVTLTGQNGQPLGTVVFAIKTQPAGPTIPNSGVTTTDYYVLADCDYPNFIKYGYSTGQYQIADVLNIGGVCYTITAVQALDATTLGVTPINLDSYYANIYTACSTCKSALGGTSSTTQPTTNTITVNSTTTSTPDTTGTNYSNSTSLITTTQTISGQTTVNGVTYDSSGAVIAVGSTTTMN